MNIENIKKKLVLSDFTTILIVICVLYYLLVTLYGLIHELSFSQSSLILGANANYYVYYGEYWRLLASVFMHGSIIHLFVNMYSLKNIGSEIEYTFGKYKFLAIFLFTGVVGSFLSYYASIVTISNGIISPLLNPHISVGASGAVFGLLGYLLVKKLNERKLMMEGKYLNVDMNSLLVVIILNLGIGFISPGIDNNAHVGGFISGIVLGLIF